MIKSIKHLVQPLHILESKLLSLVIGAWVIVIIGLWQLTANGLIPTPLIVLNSLGRILTGKEFYDNLFASLALSFKGMGISLVIAVVVSYLSLIPLFRPLTNFVIKCRYLTITGLIFLFTLLTQDGGQLKISLLIFGIVPFFVTSLMSIIDNINPQEYELCKTLRMNNWQSVLEVVIIGRIDQVIEVIRQNFAIAWGMITLVEGLSMSQGGIGTMIIKSNKYLDLGAVFAELLIIFAIGLAFDYLLTKFRYWIFPYNKLLAGK